MRRLTLAFALSALVVGACDGARGSASHPGDEAALRELEGSYTAAWRANDPDAVMATLVDDDPVLVPDGLEAIEGVPAVRAFWWPDDGSVTTITDYRTSIDEVGVSGDLGYVRGRGDLAFTWRGPEGAAIQRRSQSTFLMVARRGSDGRWRIATRMWSNLP